MLIPSIIFSRFRKTYRKKIAMRSLLTLSFIFVLLFSQNVLCHETKGIGIISANLFLRPYLLFQDGQKERFFHFQNYLKSKIEKIDVIFHQEIFEEQLIPQVIVAYRKLGLNYVTKILRTKWHPISSGLVIFSKWPIVTQKYKVFKNCWGGDCLGPKGLVYIKIKGPSQQYYHLINTHFQSGLSEIDSRHRKAQARVLKEFISEIRKKDNYPVILGGDLNVPKKKKKEFTMFLEILNLKHQNAMIPSFSYDPTSNNLVGLDGDTETFKALRLDYLFLLPQKSGDFYLTDYHVMKEAKAPRTFSICLQAPLSFGPIAANSYNCTEILKTRDFSDHYPIYGRIEKKLPGLSGL